jgi:hypothetical protein
MLHTAVCIVTIAQISKSAQCFLAFLVLSLLLPSTYALPLEQTGSVSGIVQPTRAYQAVALGGFGVIMACHRTLITEGFINSRGWGTDAFVAIGMVTIAIVWTGGIIASGFLESGKPCRHDMSLCAGRLIYAPHILNATILLWFVYSLSTKFKLRLWKPPVLYTRDAWSAAFEFHIPLLINSLLTCVIMFLAAGAIRGGDYTAAVMSIVGCAVYVVRAGGSTSYNNLEVPYRNHNFIRAVLNTSHDTGTVYMTSCGSAYMHPVWSYVWPNQIQEVNATLLPALRKLEANEFNLHELRSALRESAHAVVLCTTMDNDHLHMLASWLLTPSPFEKDIKPQGLGRELFYYLYIAELFVFVQRQRLEPELRHKLCKWRVSSRSGAHDIGNEDPYGAKGGKEGLTDALMNVGAILGFIPQMDFMSVQPEKSLLLEYDPSHAEGYIGQLWTHCLQASESIFSALYIFCAIYFVDNGSAYGLHPFEIQADNKDGDVIMHQVMWRQAWHGTMVAQFTASAVAVAGAVIGGLLV